MAHSSQMRPVGDLHIWRAMPSSLRDKATIPPAWAQDWAKVLGTGELPAGLQAPRHIAHAKNTPKTHHRALKTSFGINLTILVNYMVLLFIDKLACHLAENRLRAQTGAPHEPGLH